MVDFRERRKMFVPVATSEFRVDFEDLEARTIVDVRILRAAGEQHKGGFTGLLDRATILAQTIASLPHCAVAEFRRLDTIRARYRESYERHAGAFRADCRVALKLHVLGAHENDVLADIQLVIGHLLNAGSWSADDFDGFVHGVLYPVALKWLASCRHLRLFESVVATFGEPTTRLHARYRELLARTLEEPGDRSRYGAWLHSALAKATSPSSSARLPELLSLAEKHGIAVGQLLEVFRRLTPEAGKLESQRRSIRQGHEIMVDEGRAEWTARHLSDLKHLGPPPIVPIENGAEEEVVDQPELSANNPYRVGLEMMTRIQQTLGPAYVEIAAEVACVPSRLLSQMMPVAVYEKLPTTAEWHPSARIKRLASLSAEEVKRIREAPPGLRLVALASTIDRPLGSLSRFAVEFMESQEEA